MVFQILIIESGRDLFNSLFATTFERYQYLKKYYEQEGVVDILSKEKTDYIWGAAARDYTPRTLSYLSIYRKKVEPAI